MTHTATTAGEPFVHPALFYRGDEEYVDGTVPFLLKGLASGESTAVAAPPDRLRLIRYALGTQADSVYFVDMTRAGRNPGRIIPSVLRAFADGRSEGRVRIIGEPVWPGRSTLEYPACVQHEALINRAFTGREVTILCPYDAVGLPARAIADAYATHPVVITGGTEVNSAAYDVEGVLERCNEALPHPSATATADFTAGTLAVTRDFALQEARALGMAAGRLQDLALIVAELTTNSVVHGGGSGTLRLWAEDARLVCEVADGGRLTDPLAGRRPAAPAQIGGRGLLLVNSLSDLVRVHSGERGTTIRSYLSLP
ncbi:anti-sigma factor RsbA family regulatory protein [Streptomyces cavernae]|uniref:anti-sigma factor RsbA family regulatory protein n=1 Tax=Streptomyces cavernae TaxID=2259034 RepID=UPI000FEBF740|nr:anti-sigma factor RsbA family regulatory protein [Streptomyces cavernae]